METTVMFSSVLGPIMLLLGVGMIVNTSFYQGILDTFIKEKALLLVSGMGGVFAGIYMVSNHNVWVGFAAVLVSLLGWIVLLKSSLILAFPGFFMNLVKYINYPNWLFKVFGILYIAIGLYLSNIAYLLM